MANSYKTLAQGQVAASVGTIYTPSGSTSAIVKEIIFLNTDSANRTLSVYQNGTAAANQIFGSATLGPGETVVFTGAITLANGDTLKAVADSGSKITYTLEGVEIS